MKYTMLITSLFAFAFGVIVSVRRARGEAGLKELAVVMLDDQLEVHGHWAEIALHVAQHVQTNQTISMA